jgi:hypothetical protein
MCTPGGRPKEVSVIGYGHGRHLLVDDDAHQLLISQAPSSREKSVWQ